MTLEYILTNMTTAEIEESLEKLQQNHNPSDEALTHEGLLLRALRMRTSHWCQGK